MKHIILSSTIALTLTGCATWFPAAVQEMGDGVYKISATGNSFASQEKMKIKLVKKAESICKENGFDYVTEPKVDWKKQKDYSTGITTSYKVMNISIKCNTAL